MYFDLAPKERRSDLYDFEEAFEDLKNLLSSPVQRNPLIVVKGAQEDRKNLPDQNMPQRTCSPLLVC
jgi:hypothetical protein